MNSLNSSIINNWWERQEYSTPNSDVHDLDFDKIAKCHIELHNPNILLGHSETNLQDLNLSDKQEDVLPDLRYFKKTYTNYDIYQQKVQRWKCVVTNINDKGFRAKLEDQYEEINTTYEIAEFDFEEVSPSDLSLLHVGAVFYWSVGYENKKGQITKRSSIRFQRLVLWNEEEYESALAKAEDLNKKIVWE